ncbi:hypothetical protein ASPSYDRAFT_42056 [Aspergillus sydowii CBS 593.65]|uniref:SnoaL-like domain-containing protein n=1 Tax=Aspergillus sydowii CBS 593.65 TaxID=1036612 RepID=A0A1L9TLM6_9EURO|nr:uncharacterized protein ASPSYDRAFT_42056 [Aspergillus sydowii CBS 593.65]OJJ60336.1 hypothetical protein ASPSYDRAFT_42056 [Aspergillus sydowii CBS 593.65]
MSTPNGNIWAGSGSPKAMQVIDRFYSLLDAETPEAAKEMSQMCTEDAVFITPGQTFKGRQEIYTQRLGFWEAFPGLRHQPLRVYVSPSSPLDVVVVNSATFPTKDGVGTSYTAANWTLAESNGAYLVRKLELFLNPAAFGWT